MFDKMQVGRTPPLVDSVQAPVCGGSTCEHWKNSMGADDPNFLIHPSFEQSANRQTEICHDIDSREKNDNDMQWNWNTPPLIEICLKTTMNRE